MCTMAYRETERQREKEREREIPEAHTRAFQTRERCGDSARVLAFRERATRIRLACESRRDDLPLARLTVGMKHRAT